MSRAIYASFLDCFCSISRDSSTKLAASLRSNAIFCPFKVMSGSRRAKGLMSVFWLRFARLWLTKRCELGKLLVS